MSTRFEMSADGGESERASAKMESVFTDLYLYLKLSNKDILLFRLLNISNKIEARILNLINFLNLKVSKTVTDR